MDDIVGHTIANRYYVASFLGKGGMANVYKIWDQSRMATLAIKVLNPKLAEDPFFWDHFRQEARALADLDHPKIVRFYSLERDGGMVFIVMDYAEGSTLKDEIRARGILSNQRIWEIMRDICAALHYAHEKGYVHCDIKPANIILDKNDSALVSDFGIARAAGGYSNSFVSGGTAGYMSPEQIRGETPTRASDIYALGVLLYEMLTGRRPFVGQFAQVSGSTSERVRWEQMNLQPLSPRKINPSISFELEKIILRCLDRYPARRYASVQDILSALDPCLRVDTRTRVHKPQVVDTTTTGMDGIAAKREEQRKSPQKILVWLIAVSAIVALFVMMLINNKPVLSTITSIPALKFPTLTPVPTVRPPFDVRPYNQNTDAGLDCVWCRVADLVWPMKPGHYYWSVEFPANTPALLIMGWCATDRATLDSNWGQMDYDLVVDGYLIADSQLDVSLTRNGDLYCYDRAGVLDGWPRGAHTYVETHHIDTSLFDGMDTYEAGDYIFEFAVTVK